MMIRSIFTLLATAACIMTPTWGQVLTREDANLASQVAQMAQDIYAEPELRTADNNPNRQYFQSSDNADAVYVERDVGAGRCIILFRGTTRTMTDWMQNFDTDITTMHSRTDPRKTCQISEGYHRAYHNDIQGPVEAAVDQCAHNGLSLLFAGHSQGGALAMIAAARHEAFNPRVLTLGTAPSFMDSCPMLPDSSIVNIFNTEQANTIISPVQFDFVPFLTKFGLRLLVKWGPAEIARWDYFGYKGVWYALVPTSKRQDASLVFWSRKNDVPYGLSDTVDFSGFSTAHRIGDYLQKINYLRDMNRDIPANGFPSFVYCNSDEFCEGFCTDHGMCTFGADYEPCWRHDECQNRYCAHTSHGKFRCAPLKQYGEDCSSANCASGLHCAWNKCRDGRDGEPCQSGRHCNSGRCDMDGFHFKCHGRLSRGKRCNEDSDCQSNNCNWYWKCT